MLLTEIISLLDYVLGKPSVSLDERGLRLFYTDLAMMFHASSSLPLGNREYGYLLDRHTILIPHRNILRFLLDIGAKEMGLRESIELFYELANVDRVECYAQESVGRHVTNQRMSDELLKLKRIGLGPRPKQLIADITINMPLPAQDEALPPSRVFFLLDRSWKMNGERLDILKTAVINAIDQLPASTLVSVYFYNDDVETIFENKTLTDITQTDRTAILNMTADSDSFIPFAIEAMVKNMRGLGLFEDSQSFENLTIAWLTVGNDYAVRESTDLVRALHLMGCQVMPQLITVGINCNELTLFNSIAADSRFKTNPPLFINTIQDMAKLSDVLVNSIGVRRKKVIVVIETESQMTFKDLEMMKEGQVKKVLMDFPMPSNRTSRITCRVLIDEQVHAREMNLPRNFNQSNTDLLVAYFMQLQDKITLIRKHDPDAAEVMRKEALAQIPSTVLNRQLSGLRQSFILVKPELFLLEEDLISTSRQSPWLPPGQSILARQSEQCLQDKIRVQKRLVHLMNSIIDLELWHLRMEVTQMDFISQSADIVFKIKLSHVSCDRDLKDFYQRFNIDKTQAIIVGNLVRRTVDICLSNASAITKLFEAMGYEALLDNHFNCLASHVDLLQLLLADTVSRILIESKISPNVPEMIEFDALGNLSAVVVAPNNARYKLKNTHEVCGFLKQYCAFQLPGYFVELLRQQVVKRALRYRYYLDSTNAEGTPIIFADNQFVSFEFCQTKKTITAVVERRDTNVEPLNVQERHFFQKSLSQAFGENFLLKWILTGKQYRLVISSANEPFGFTYLDIASLVIVLQTHKLLPHHSIASELLDRFESTPSESNRPMPESIENILACQIMLTVPEGVPYITPSGYTYNMNAIFQHLEYSNDEPMTREQLTFLSLRPNLLVERLILHYNEMSNAQDPEVHLPALLIDPMTGGLYDDPVVLHNGETVSRRFVSLDLTYPNRCVADLIAHYNSVLVARPFPIERSGIRATIGANLGLLCPGTGALTEAAARDENETGLPYVEYDVLTSTLCIHFLSQEYARRFELGLKRWNNDRPAIQFPADSISRADVQNIKIVRGVEKERIELVFHSTVSIVGNKAINLLFERLCKLSPAYFKALQKLSGSNDMNAFDQVTQRPDHQLICVDRIRRNRFFHSSEQVSRPHPPTGARHSAPHV